MTRPSRYLADLEDRLHPLRARLADHPLYASIQSLEALQIFMEAHVFAVWDFMALLKTLQRGLTSVDVPWTPSENAEARRLINEIVLGEESDLYNGRPASHFEIYLDAMRAAGADTNAILSLLERIKGGTPVRIVLDTANVPTAARAFVESTFALIDQQQLHTVAAAFTFGREDLIPDMFRGFVRDLDRAMHGRLEIFLWYLERHIEVDGEEHGPMALRMVSSLCGDDEQRWQEAGAAAESALRARIALWDGILQKIQQAAPTVLAAAAASH